MNARHGHHRTPACCLALRSTSEATRQPAVVYPGLRAPPDRNRAATLPTTSVPVLAAGVRSAFPALGIVRGTVPEMDLHGQRVTYHLLGDGPAILLIHGITSSSRTWRSVMHGLAERHTVVAPDLAGHGRSGKPRGDYSLGAYASGLRDLLAVLGISKATVVGHSLGGGIAMQFAYQFPDRMERLVLVDSGGLGEEVSLALRAATLPGAEFVLPLLFSPITRTDRARDRAGARTLRREGECRRARPRRGPGLAGRPRRPARIRPYGPLGHRRKGPAGRRSRPPIPLRGPSDDADLGGEGPDHSARARAPRARS